MLRLCQDCGLKSGLLVTANGRRYTLCGACITDRHEAGEAIDVPDERHPDDDDGRTYADPRDETDDRLLRDL